MNSVEGGFGKGLDRVIETVKKEIARLAKVGVKVWWTAHVKEKDQTDLFTGTNYTTLTANMSMKYFNSIKNVSHIIGFGYFDRTVEKQEVGEANAVTKKKKTRNAVTDETRKIKFRDDAMIADAKSRFAKIIDEIVLDTDEFIKAVTDAINAAGGADTAVEKKTTKHSTKKPEPIEEEDELLEQLKAAVDIAEEPEDSVPFDIDEPEDIFQEEVDEVITLDDDRMGAIRESYKTASSAVKADVKVYLAEYNGRLVSKMKQSHVNAIEKILGIGGDI